MKCVDCNVKSKNNIVVVVVVVIDNIDGFLDYL
jgi:hypothetical protein